MGTTFAPTVLQSVTLGTRLRLFPAMASAELAQSRRLKRTFKHTAQSLELSLSMKISLHTRAESTSTRLALLWVDMQSKSSDEVTMLVLTTGSASILGTELGEMVVLSRSNRATAESTTRCTLVTLAKPPKLLHPDQTQFIIT